MDIMKSIEYILLAPFLPKKYIKAIGRADEIGKYNLWAVLGIVLFWFVMVIMLFKSLDAYYGNQFEDTLYLISVFLVQVVLFGQVFKWLSSSIFVMGFDAQKAYSFALLSFIPIIFSFVIREIHYDLYLYTYAIFAVWSISLLTFAASFDLVEPVGKSLWLVILTYFPFRLIPFLYWNFV
jgi:hypothetical protein